MFTHTSLNFVPFLGILLFARFLCDDYVNFFCRGQVGYRMLFERTQACNHRSVLNILDSLLANQISAKDVVTIVCRIEIRKMAEC